MNFVEADPPAEICVEVEKELCHVSSELPVTEVSEEPGVVEIRRELFVFRSRETSATKTQGLATTNIIQIGLKWFTVQDL